MIIVREVDVRCRVCNGAERIPGWTGEDEYVLSERESRLLDPGERVAATITWFYEEE
ncbi:MAG TPA: hypothetical protein VFR23_24850 [Jiangellaceae bacterium]|nr:hypothetical protein [Jiangellaceae bacterium]